MISTVKSGTILGLTAIPIDVEVDVAAKGLPSLTIVGLPDKAVQEAKERVRAALQNSSIAFPAKRITINLSPADIPKQGPAFDLPIALGLMLANGEVEYECSTVLVTGELSLDGSVKPATGVLALALMAKETGIKEIIVPVANAAEAAIVTGMTVTPVASLSQLVGHMSRLEPIPPHPVTHIHELIQTQSVNVDMADIYGQHQAKRCLEISAAGGHNLYLYGSPGAGKTMLAKAIAGILPRLTTGEAIELTNIFSMSGNLPGSYSFIAQRPFRNPHHTTSKIGLVGGGSFPKPGEISLAHRGVLFLDELPEFPRHIIESLRAPLEDGAVHIARAAQTISYPCRFMLVAAANPCPCGHLGSKNQACTCSTQQILNYQKKISGPMLDRIDLHLEVPPVEITTLIRHSRGQGETSAAIRERVQIARDIQVKRFASTTLTCNADMSTKHVQTYCPLGGRENQFLVNAANTLGLSARSFYKIIKVARTVADLAGENTLTVTHLSEALQYRPQVKRLF